MKKWNKPTITTLGAEHTASGGDGNNSDFEYLGIGKFTVIGTSGTSIIGDPTGIGSGTVIDKGPVKH